MEEKQLIDIEIKNINEELDKNTTVHERIAVWCSEKIGSMSFVYVLLFFIVSWIFINIFLLISGGTPFDTPYEFSRLLFLSNTIQLLTPLFILVSQNIQAKRDKAFADQDYAKTKKTEQETKLMFDYLKNFQEQFKTLFNKLNVQQHKIIGLEEQQQIFNEMISANLIKALSAMEDERKIRPCLLEQTTKEKELHEYLIKALEKFKEEKGLEK